MSLSGCIKRIGDIVIALVMLAVCIIPMMIVALLIYLEDRDSPIFTQPRLTKDGKVFTLYKFRSMIQGTEEDYGLTLEDDPRVTSVGKVIRKYRIDELPQLINVIKGDMSMVGPRPERPQIAKEIEAGLPEFADRLQVIAGLTGYAQVYGKYGTPPEEKLAMDMYYINNFSIWLDIKILFRTVRVVFDKESSEGIKVQ